MVTRLILLSFYAFICASSISYAAQDDKKKDDHNTKTTTPTTQGGDKTSGNQAGTSNITVNKDVNCEIQ